MLQKFPMYAYIPVKDMARARQFYEQKIGLKPGREISGGVVYDSIATAKGAKAAWFKDTEGNIMALVESQI